MANENPTQELQVREKQQLEQESTRPGLVFRPDVDILEQPDAYVIYADLPGADEKSVPPAERPPGSEEELARGRVEQTPVTVINWVAVVIGALVALALAVVVVAYVIA